MRTRHSTLLLALCLAGSVFAQGKMGTLGSGTPKGPPMSLDQLRTCLNQQADLNKRRPQVEAERDALQRERQELTQIDNSLKADHEALDKLTAAVADVNKRSVEFQKDLAEYNERSAAVQKDTRGGPIVDRQRAQLERDRVKLDATGKALEAERTELGPKIALATKTYNERQAARDAAAADWNARSAQHSKAAQAYETERENWTIDCAGRPYREDDEKLIQSGK